MAETRCPMCSKPNPEDAVECTFCGARLKPLVVDDQSSGSPPPDQPQSSSSGEEEVVPDWLNRIRARADEEEPAEEPAEESDTDWLSRLRSVETDDSGPPEELPDWLEEEQDPADEDQGEDWLNRLRETTSEPLTEAGQMAAPMDEGEAEEQDTSISEDQEAAPEQQLRDMWQEEESSQETGQTEQPQAMEDESEALDWLGDEVESDLPEAELPDWIDDEEQLTEADLPEAGAMATDVPEWFDEFEQAAGEEAPEPGPVEGQPEAPETPKAAIEEDAFEAFEQDDLPDWLDEESIEEADQFEPGEMEISEGIPTEDKAEGTADDAAEVDWQEFDWESIADEGEAEAAPLPEGLGAPPEEEEELPHVPALIFGDEDEGPIGAVSDEFDLDAIELPDWLSEVDREAAGTEQSAQSGDLAPATIPNWLEAMRPVETFQPVVDIEPEEERAVESVGPLAGLRGVLLAEPVVAKPRTATSVGERLQVTERQYAQADILRRIVEREDQERVGPRERSKRLPLVRWIISLVLVASVLLPPILGIPRFAAPTRVSRDLGPMLEVINSVESDQPALVVFDYEPGYSAELEAVSGAMLENLMARGVNIVTLSTRPTGPPLALQLIEDIGEPHGIENGRDYIHLGYLSGGPTAVQLFSIAPKEAVLKGFMLPSDLEIQSGWDAPILRNVERLADFGMVAVITAGTDNARIWAEQAHPWLNDTRMVMVLSAGAEPMIRPYFESLDPQVDGILTGLPAAVAYEQINNRPGQALNRWNAFGSGVLAVEVILAAGLVYGLVGWVIERRRESEQG